MSKHTSGIWEIEMQGKYSGDIRRLERVGPQGGRYYDKWICSIGYQLREEDRANAQLITAAPDLLDACSDMIIALNIASTAIGCEPPVCIKRAKAAIAKAKEKA